MLSHPEGMLMRQSEEECEMAGPISLGEIRDVGHGEPGQRMTRVPRASVADAQRAPAPKGEGVGGGRILHRLRAMLDRNGSRSVGTPPATGRVFEDGRSAG